MARKYIGQAWREWDRLKRADKAYKKVSEQFKAFSEALEDLRQAFVQPAEQYERVRKEVLAAFPLVQETITFRGVQLSLAHTPRNWEVGRVQTYIAYVYSIFDPKVKAGADVTDDGVPRLFSEVIEAKRELMALGLPEVPEDRRLAWGFWNTATIVNLEDNAHDFLYKYLKETVYRLLHDGSGKDLCVLFRIFLPWVQPTGKELRLTYAPDFHSSFAACLAILEATHENRDVVDTIVEGLNVTVKYSDSDLVVEDVRKSVTARHTGNLTTAILRLQSAGYKPPPAAAAGDGESYCLEKDAKQDGGKDFVKSICIKCSEVSICFGGAM